MCINMTSNIRKLLEQIKHLPGLDVNGYLLYTYIVPKSYFCDSLFSAAEVV